jgi:hypothetical protein
VRTDGSAVVPAEGVARENRPWVRRCGVSDGTRTRDTWDHNPVLYQLSYTHHDRPRRRTKCTGRYVPLVLVVIATLTCHRLVRCP